MSIEHQTFPWFCRCCKLDWRAYSWEKVEKEGSVWWNILSIVGSRDLVVLGNEGLVLCFLRASSPCQDGSSITNTMTPKLVDSLLFCFILLNLYHRHPELFPCSVNLHQLSCRAVAAALCCENVSGCALLCYVCWLCWAVLWLCSLT